MTDQSYQLKFSIAGRTIFSRQLNLMHWNAFGIASIDNFREKLPTLSDPSWHGYVIHSAECSNEKPGVTSNGEYLLYIIQTYPRYLTRFQGSFEDFLGSLSSKSRSTLRRKVKKFARRDNRDVPEWRAYQTPEEIREFFSHALPLAERTYQARLFNGALPSSSEFQKQALQAASSGNLRAYILFLEQVPVAYLYTPKAENSYLYEYLGYDEQISNLSPGTVLQYLVHQHLFEDKSAEFFDFTEGEGNHKALFANESSHCCTALYIKNRGITAILVYAHRIWDSAIEQLKVMTAKVDGSAKIRRLFRK